MYYALFDRLIQEFNRFADFGESVKKFSCLLPDHLGETELFKQLAEHYVKDLDVDSATSEYNQLCSLIQTTPEMQAELVNASVQDVLLFLKRNKLDIAYPHLVTLLIYYNKFTISIELSKMCFVN